MKNKALKELLEQYNLEDILELMGFEVVSTEVEDVYDTTSTEYVISEVFGLGLKGIVIGYNETITVKREVR